MTETFILWARTAQQREETPTTDNFTGPGHCYGNAYEYLRRRAIWHAMHRGAVAFSVRDPSGMRVYERWRLDERLQVVPRERRAPPELYCQELLRSHANAGSALASARCQNLLDPYWAKVVEILETCAATAAKE